MPGNIFKTNYFDRICIILRSENLSQIHNIEGVGPVSYSEIYLEDPYW